MAKQLTEYQKSKRRAASTRVWSTEDTQLPKAWEIQIKKLMKVEAQEVLAFDLKIWFKSRGAHAAKAQRGQGEQG